MVRLLINKYIPDLNVVNENDGYKYNINIDLV